ncbi:MAG: sugar ABC transporter substrate-binding protein, partial [Planctomycetota bacterium]|nr:sugar ABC transporter substrate-binding protein [Planctomycetota bacterium]
MRNFLFRALSFVVAATLLAGIAVAGEKKGPFKFGYTCMDGSNPFFVIIEKTMRDAVTAKGDTLIATDPANDVNRQINQIEDM